MSNVNFDRTGTYDSSDESKTGTYESRDNVSKTYAYDDLREKQFKSKTHGIGVGDSITLRDKKYSITDIISEGTGEAVIYKVRDAGGKIFALKLYFEFSNPKEEPNYETLRNIIGITDPDVLKLYDFGARYESEKYLGKYCYEVSDYARGGDLFSVQDFKAKYTQQFIEKVIIPELFKGIKKLHELKIYHCDLKPSNIFYANEKQTDIVIGDYGSGKFFGASGDSGKANEDRSIRKTSTVKGTEFYLPPEQARGIISEKNDYYSFGMILLHLLYPEWICEASDFTKIDKRKNELISEHQFDSKEIIKFDEKFGRLNQLIAGLTLAFNKNRWGKSEVERWIKGENPEIKYSSAETVTAHPVKLSYATIHTEKDLIEVLETQPDWYEDLIEDESTYQTLKLWLNSYKNIPTRKVVENLVAFYQPYGKESVKEALIRYFDPARPIRVDMNSFNVFAAPNAAMEVESFVKKLDEIWKITSLNMLGFYLFQLEFSLRQREAAGGGEDKIVVGALIDKIYSIFGASPTPFDNFRTEIIARIDQADEQTAFRALINLFYAFDAERAFRDQQNHSIKTVAELGLFYAQNDSAFTNKYLNVEKEKFLEKIGENRLNRLDYNSFIFEIFKSSAEAKVEIVDLTFDLKRNYEVSYRFYKSLKNFFSRNKVNRDFASRSAGNEIYRHRRGFLKNFESEAENFIQSVCQRHNIKTLPNENISQIKEQFKNQSRERYVYLWFERFLGLKSKLAKKTFIQIEEEGNNANKKLHWRAALVSGAISFFAFLLFYALFAVFAGWIVWDTGSRYLTLNNSVRLDGIGYSRGDNLKVSSENEFFICTGKDNDEKCFPTQNLIDSGLNQQTIPIESVGKFDYEFSTPRDVFKVSDDFNLGYKGKKYHFNKGDIVNITIQKGANNKDLYCFSFGRAGSDCFPSDTKFVDDKGKFTNYFTGLGSAIKDYRGRYMFTFNKTVTLNGTTYQAGSSWEDARSGSPWIYCINSNGRKCFPTKNAIDRLRQPDVPVITKYGSIQSRKSDFNIGTWLTLGVIFAGLVFAGTFPLAKKFKLFLLRGQLGTLKFNNMKAMAK